MLGIKKYKMESLYSNDDLNIRHLKHWGGGGTIESIDPIHHHLKMKTNAYIVIISKFRSSQTLLKSFARWAGTRISLLTETSI